jgi:hypothetical protein
MAGADGQEDTFSLLFLRDSREVRSRLCQAAQECFVFSALLHDNLGRWAFQEVFPDSEARVECCRRWLQRCGAEARASIVQYLIQAQGEEARQYVVDLVLADADRESVSWRDVAVHLSEPLMAARFRTDVAVSVLEMLGNRGLAQEEPRSRFREFAAMACADDPNDLMNLLVSCAHRLEGSLARNCVASANGCCRARMSSFPLRRLAAVGTRVVRWSCAAPVPGFS